MYVCIFDEQKVSEYVCLDNLCIYVCMYVIIYLINLELTHSQELCHQQISANLKSPTLLCSWSDEVFAHVHTALLPSGPPALHPQV